jgi:hypothetical protein
MVVDWGWPDGLGQCAVLLLLADPGALLRRSGGLANFGSISVMSYGVSLAMLRVRVYRLDGFVAYGMMGVRRGDIVFD